jgi:DnaJ-class molecular chaperone
MERGLVPCKNCGGTGYDFATSNNPSEKAFKVECGYCYGEGAYTKQDKKLEEFLKVKFFTAYFGIGS